MAPKQYISINLNEAEGDSVMEETPKWGRTRPFHETIIGAIRRCPCLGSGSGEIMRLIQLIQETTIPEGHLEIIVAIDEYFDSNAEALGVLRRWVTEGLLAQKQANTKKSR